MRTCLVIGNGKSLKDIPNEFLEKYTTFGSNRIYLKYEPDYYAVVNPLVIEQFYEEINKVQSVKFVPSGYQKLIPSSIALPIKGKWQFNKNPLIQCHEGWTVTFVLLQLAYFCRYKKVGLIGVDHYYDYQGNPNQTLVGDETDPNHFDPTYFANCKWHAPDLKRSEKSYQMAKEAFEADGRKIVNLTNPTALKVFEFEDWRNW